MSERIERELQVPAGVGDVWEAVIADGWLADEVELDLRPGGDARFRWNDAPSEKTAWNDAPSENTAWNEAPSEKTGWIEQVREPADGGVGRLAFWWSAGDQPATRVEVTIAPDGELCSWIRVVESRPLEALDLVGTPLPGADGTTTYGPVLLAA